MHSEEVEGGLLLLLDAPGLGLLFCEAAHESYDEGALQEQYRWIRCFGTSSSVTGRSTSEMALLRMYTSMYAFREFLRT
jgi:hypothetical protein